MSYKQKNENGNRVWVIGISVLSLCFLFFFICNKNKPLKTNQELGVTESSSIRSNLAVPNNSAYLDRSHLIEAIEKKLDKQQGIQTVTLVGVIGLGGAGKTTLARYYARSQNMPVVWEINAETRESLLSSFKDLAYNLAKTSEAKEELNFIQSIQKPEEKEKKIFAFVKNNLKQQSKWLLIYDNVENISIIKDYLPYDTRIWGEGKVILTTRDSNVNDYTYINPESITTYINPENVIQINELSPLESLTLFSKILYNTIPSKLSSDQREKTRSFLSNVPPFPLDVSVAAYYIKNNNISYDEYLQKITHYTQDFEKTQELFLKELNSYTKTRYGIITASLENIIKENELFKKLILFISLLDSQNIPKELLEIYGDQETIDFLLYNLRKYSLLTSESPCATNLCSTFSIHRSTQNICRIHLTRILSLNAENSLLESIFKDFRECLNKIIEEEAFTKIQSLETHCTTLLSRSIISNITKGQIGSALGCMYHYVGSDTRAKKILEESISWLDQLDDNDIQKAKIFMYLGSVYRNLGNFVKAKDFLEKSLNIYKQNYSQNNINIARVLSHLGNVYKDLGEPEKATEIFEESLKIYQQYPDNYVGLSRVLTFLGTLYRELGLYEKAQEVLEHSLNICQQHPDNPMGLAMSLARLGNLYRELGLYAKAKDYLEKSLHIYDQYSSPKNTNRGWALVYLGSLYRDLKDYVKAKEFLEKGLLIHKENHPESNINVGWILTYLGAVHNELGAYEKAKAYLEESLTIYQQNCSKDDINLGWNFVYLGAVYKNLGDHEKAAYLFRKSFLIYEKYFLENKANITWIFPYLGDIYRKLDKYSQSQIITEKCLISHEKHYKNDHVRTAMAMQTVGGIYLLQQKYEQAEDLLKASLKILQQKDHPDAYLPLENLASLHKQYKGS